MKPAPSPAHEHDLSLDAAVEFLNSLELQSGVLVDHLHEPDDARAWFVEQGVIHEDDHGAWTDRDLDRVRSVRDALRAVLDAVVDQRPPDPGAIGLVNEALGDGQARRLELDGSEIRLGHRHGSTQVGDALAALADPIVTELASGRPDRFRTCANDTCRWSFYDASPTGRRRWCDMRTCGNRAKAARHRERAKEAAESPSSPVVRRQTRGSCARGLWGEDPPIGASTARTDSPHPTVARSRKRSRWAYAPRILGQATSYGSDGVRSHDARIVCPARIADWSMAIVKPPWMSAGSSPTLGEPAPNQPAG